MVAFGIGTEEPPLVFGLARRLRRFSCYAELVECLSAPRFAAEAPAQAIAEGVVMLSSIGAADQALSLAQAGLARMPADPSLLFVRGNLHAFAGRFNAAEADYEQSMVSDPALFQASWMLAGLRRQRPEDNHVERLRAQLARATTGRMGEIYLNFALHKELDDLGRHREAWEALERGCRAKRRKIAYDPEATAALFDALREVCTASFVTTSPDIGAGQPMPVFIVGMHRSGTTLLERMLGAHTSVVSGGESHAFAEAMKLATNYGAPGVLHLETVRRAQQADFAAVADSYGVAARWLARGHGYFTEKLPGNFLHAGFIARALPHARIIHMRRDAVGTCFSNLRTLFSEAAPYSYEQQELAGYHRHYKRLAEHWHEVLGPRILDVDYAALVVDPEGQMRRIAAFCGLPFETAMLSPSGDGSSVVTASAADVRSGIVAGRDNAWEPYEAYLQPLLEELQRR